MATAENAARYFHDFYLQAQEKGIPYYYFSAFDEPWKGPTPWRPTSACSTRMAN